MPLCTNTSIGGFLNDCYVHIYLQLAAALLVIIWVCGALWKTRFIPRGGQPTKKLDKVRSVLLAFVFLIPVGSVINEILLSNSDSDSSESPAEMFGAFSRVMSMIFLSVWHAHESHRGFQEALLLKAWWLLGTMVRVLLVWAAIKGPDGIESKDIAAGFKNTRLLLALLEVIFSTAYFLCYLFPAGRETREPLLSDAERGSISTGFRLPSLEGRIGTIGRLSFSWFTPLVDLAVEREKDGQKLDPLDLYPLMESDYAEKQKQRLEREWRIELEKEKPSLIWAMSRAFKWEVLSTAWIKLINDALHFAGPFLLHRILSFVKGNDEEQYIGYIYALGMVLSSAIQAFSMAHYFQRGYRCGMKIRAGLILMAYDKALKVLPWEQKQTPEEAAAAPGAETQGRRCFCCKKSAAPPPKPASVGGVGQMTNLISADTDKFTFLMPYFNLFWSGPLQLVLCFSMLAFYVGWALIAGTVVMLGFTFLSGVIQKKARTIQQTAMKLKDERLKTEVELLKIVKIIKMYAWETTIEDRVKDLRNAELKAQLKYKLINMWIFMSFSLSPTLVALSTFSFYTVIMKKDLDAATAFTALSLFNILTFPLSIMPMMIRFWMEAQVSSHRLQAFFLAKEVSPRNWHNLVPGPWSISLRASQIRWPDGSELLKDVALEVKRSEFVVLVGATGSGKSGLLYTLLGEVPLEESDGRLSVAGSIGYCAQTAWVQNATLKENILSGAHEVDDTYEQVLDACALRQDLEVLPNGDQTLIGDRGINLSGGQKQRVALARCAFADADILILDDVLSALDAHVAAHISTNLLRGPLLKGKTIVLVTHSKRVMPMADRIVAVKDKTIVFNGSYDDFKKSGIMNDLEDAIQDEPTSPNSIGSEKKSDDKAKSENKSNGKGSGKGAGKGDKKQDSGPRADERQSGAITWATYRAYASACGGIVPVGIFLLSVIAAEGSKNLSDAWLTKWSESGGTAKGAEIYALCALFALVGSACYVTSRIFVGQRASKGLHQDCVHGLLRAKMTFYDLTPTGQILNRLAEDTNILDYNLPQTLGANFVWFWRSAAIVIVCMLVGWYLLFLIVPMFWLYSRLAKRYLPSTRDLRRLDAAARSPIFQHLSETLNGAMTLRAMAKSKRMIDLQVKKLETQMEAYYLSNTAARWLSLRLQVNGTILLGSVVMLGVAFSTRNKSNGIPAGILGLAITYAMKLTDTLNQVNRESADRETQMVSVERVHHYNTNVEHEAALIVPGENVQASWPARGNIVLNDVTCQYRPELPVVLDGVSVSIRAGERIGVVGRTGCGKSSLLLTLMRIVETSRGSMHIDDVDIKAIGLHTLRKSTAIIPQEPAILTGTVRYNIDPFGAKTDAQLWEALDKSQLKERVEQGGGLDSIIEEGGGNYSVGELQLICLARAVLQRHDEGGLLLLDEATSALDAETDKTVQRVIRSDFKCTTITIAHRIQTLLDYDRILVLKDGKVAEFDAPQELLRRPSEFQSLANEAGVNEATTP